MESASIRRAPPLPGLIQLGLIGLLIALAALAWAISNDQMAGMDAGPGTDPGTLGFFLGVWLVMMAAMMFPSIAPMGVIHGGWCVGCCWALMAALFALGVMSLGWMAFVAALIALEKLLPWKILANRGIALLLLALGLGVALAAEDVPGLVLPNSAETQQAMQSMGMGGGSMGSEEQSGGMKDDSMGSGHSGAITGGPTKVRSGAGMGGESMPDSSP